MTAKTGIADDCVCNEQQKGLTSLPGLEILSAPTESISCASGAKPDEPKGESGFSFLGVGPPYDLVKWGWAKPIWGPWPPNA